MLFPKCKYLYGLVKHLCIFIAIGLYSIIISSLFLLISACCLFPKYPNVFLSPHCISCDLNVLIWRGLLMPSTVKLYCDCCVHQNNPASL